MNRFIVFSLLIFSLASIARAEDSVCKVPTEGFDLISTFRPDIQAGIEAKKSSPKFLAVLNYSVVVPSVPGLENCWSKAEMVRVIPGTTDTPCSEALNIFQVAAMLYADQYNKQLLLLRPDFLNHSCAVKSSRTQ